MFEIFSEIDLSDNATPTQSSEIPPNSRANRKHFSLSHKHISNSPSPTNQINSSLYLNNSFHDITSPPPPPLSLLDTSSSLSSNFSTPSNPSRYPALSSSSISPPLTTISTDSSSLSPKNLTRSTGSIDLTRRTFNFPISRHDSIIESLLSAIYERDGSVYGLSSSQDSDTVTTGDCTDQSNPRRLSDDSILHDDNTSFSKSNLTNKSKYFSNYQDENFN